jgi:PAS domain S-box-containing protein
MIMTHTSDVAEHISSVSTIRVFSMLFISFVAGVTLCAYIFFPDTYIRIYTKVFDLSFGTGFITLLFFFAVGVPLILNIYLYVSGRTSRAVIMRLKETRDRYARALEGSGSGTWERDAKTGNIYVSARWDALFKYGDDRVPRTEDMWIETIFPEDRTATRNTYHHAIESDMRFYRSSYRMLTGTGAVRYVIDEGIVDRHTNPGHVIVYGSTRDVTPMHDAEELLKKRTEELRAANDRVHKEMLNTRKFALAVAAAGDAIVITTADGSILYGNAAWYTLTGTRKGDAGEPITIFDPFEEHSPPEEVRAMRMAFCSGGRYATDSLRGMRHEHESYDVELSLFPVEDVGKVVLYSAILIDATQRKAIDKAKTEFVSVASHQLKTPLAAIKWYVEMLVSEASTISSSHISLYVKEIDHANTRMIELVDSLLNVSRLDLGTMQWDPEFLRISNIMKEFIRELRPSLENKHISIHTLFSEDEPDIFFDKKQLSIVCQNILSNAIKYTGQGGNIEITVKPEGDHIFFTVKDNGCGIPMEQQSRIFSKMFRADNAKILDTTGSGLGLYIVKQIIDRTGGSIRFESTEGTGTTFYGILPTHPEMPLPPHIQ